MFNIEERLKNNLNINANFSDQELPLKPSYLCYMFHDTFWRSHIRSVKNVALFQRSLWSVKQIFLQVSE